MSKARGCLIVEYADGEWYVIVALDEYDYDFNTYEIFGIASTEDNAWELLDRNCSNPGGGTTVKKEKITEWMKKVIEDKYK